jgi:hypothetical protein
MVVGGGLGSFLCARNSLSPLPKALISHIHKSKVHITQDVGSTGLVKSSSAAVLHVKCNGVLLALCKFCGHASGWRLTCHRNYMTTIVGTKPMQSLKPLFATDVGVQTEMQTGEIADISELLKCSRIDLHGDQEPSLCASDLASILKWSTDISSDINLSSGSPLFN